MIFKRMVHANITIRYLDCVLPRENGVNYSPLFPIKGLIKWVQEYRKPKGTKEEKKSILRTETVEEEAPTAADDVVV